MCSASIDHYVELVISKIPCQVGERDFRLIYAKASHAGAVTAIRERAGFSRIRVVTRREGKKTILYLKAKVNDVITVAKRKGFDNSESARWRCSCRPRKSGIVAIVESAATEAAGIDHGFHPATAGALLLRVPVGNKGPAAAGAGNSSAIRAVSYTHLTLPTICSV